MMRQILLSFVIVVVGCFTLGSSLECYSCSGNRKECANAENVTCSAGQDYCSRITVEKDGREAFTLSCADKDDCNKLKMSCDASKYTNSRTECPTKCCYNVSRCNILQPEVPKQCYTCASGMSMDDCELYSEAKNCTSEEGNCAKITTEIMVGEMKVKSYRKGCRTDDQCQTDVFLEACNEDQGDKCNKDCCEGNLCNAGTFSSASVLAILACAIISVFFL